MIYRLREAALWMGAALGLLSVVAGVAVMFFGYSFLIFRSGSMGPDIPTGSLALARTTPVAELEPGDVVSVVAANGARVTHRLVDLTLRGDEGSLILQGDVNPTPDQEIYQAEEVEVEIASVPLLGYVVTVLLSPAGLVGAGCLSGMLLLAGWGSGERRDDERRADTRRVGGKHRAGHGVSRSSMLIGTGAAAAAVVASVGIANTTAYFTDNATVPATYSSTALPRPVVTCSEGAGANVTISFPTVTFSRAVTYSASLGNGQPLTITGTGGSRSVSITQAQASGGNPLLFGTSNDYAVTVAVSLSPGVWVATSSLNIRSSRAGFLTGSTDIVCLP